MPRVSISLPVFNGENYLEEAIRSVLVQTYEDFELIVTDNASEDRTQQICEDFASGDRRIVYFRNDTNLGAAPNYNLGWKKATGELFKWFAHDDRIAPGYLETTVNALDENPDAILCNTVVDYIGPDGEHLGYYASVMKDTFIDDTAARFATMIWRSHTCVDFFGLIRRDVMKDSLLHQAFSGADKAFLAQMSLRGKMLQIEPALNQMREHPNRYTRNTATSRAKLAWHDSTQSGGKDIPVMTLYRTYKELVETEALSDADRKSCRGVLNQFWLRGWNAGRLAADILSVPFPSVVSKAFNIKYRLFGGPGNFHQ